MTSTLFGCNLLAHAGCINGARMQQRGRLIDTHATRPLATRRAPETHSIDESQDVQERGRRTERTTGAIQLRASMPRKRRQRSQSPSNASPWLDGPVAGLAAAANIVAMPAAHASLAPIYGHQHHATAHEVVFAALALSIALIRPLNRHRLNALAAAAIVTLAYPPISQATFWASGMLGPRLGPSLTLSVARLPAVVLSLGGIGLNKTRPAALPYIFSILGASRLRLAATSLLMSSGALLIAAATLSLFSIRPRRVSVALLIAIAYLVAMCYFPLLQTPSSFSADTSSRLLARQQSITGIVSVLEHRISERHTIRVLRADHSLLGGVWLSAAIEQVERTLSEDEREKLGHEGIEHLALQTAEPIYSTFIAQEAVMLVKRPPRPQPSALVIGLGTGTIVRSLVRHNVTVDVCEIDPVVVAFARAHFGLRVNGEIHVEDARSLLDKSTKRYDYIVHDVFTGGSVPSMLFTQEAWRDVRSRLLDYGVLAVNVAGEADSMALRSIVGTLNSVFEGCRLFEDGPTQANFKNMLIICSASGQRVELRRPTEQDFAGSRPRREVLGKLEANEIELKSGDSLLVTDRNAQDLSQYQREGALKHWAIMREILPLRTWLYF